VAVGFAFSFAASVTFTCGRFACNIGCACEC
jgi:hypothetical protein